MIWYRSRWWWAAAAAALPVWGVMVWLWPTRLHRPELAWLLPVLLWPILEEMVFRDGVLRAVRQRPAGQRRLLGISAANAVAAVLFALIHLYAHPPAWALAVLVPGLLFGYCYERGGLLAAIALHVWYNLGYFTLYPPAA